MLLSNLRVAVGYARQRKTWVVVLCPTSGATEDARKSMAALVPSGTSGSGRTFLLPDGVRISVAQVCDEVFVPEGTPFAVLYAGWSTAGDSSLKGMDAWRARATGEVTFGATEDVA
jgi:hypothetical protein